MGKCSVQFGNKSNGIFLEYNNSYKEELSFFIYSKTSGVKQQDFCLKSHWSNADANFIKQIKNLANDSPAIKYNFGDDILIDVVIDIQGQHFYVMYMDWNENDVEQVTEVWYDLKPNDIKKLLKFVKEMQEV